MNQMFASIVAMILLGGWSVICLAQPATQPASEQSADQMLDRLLNSNNAGKTLQPIPNATAPNPAPDSPARPNIIREGSYIVDRVGRLSPTDDGSAMQFTFDSDGRALLDPPMTILPSLKLMDMEWARETKGPDTRFRITGMVTEYKGRNYLLLDKVVVTEK